MDNQLVTFLHLCCYPCRGCRECRRSKKGWWDSVLARFIEALVFFTDRMQSAEILRCVPHQPQLPLLCHPPELLHFTLRRTRIGCDQYMLFMLLLLLLLLEAAESFLLCAQQSPSSSKAHEGR